MPLFGAPPPTVGNAPEARARLAAILGQRADAMQLHGGNARGVANMPNSNELNAMQQLDGPMPMSPAAQNMGAAGAGITPQQLAAALAQNPNLANFTLPEQGGAQPSY